MFWAIRYLNTLGSFDKGNGNGDAARRSAQMGTNMRIALMTNNYKPFIAGVPISVERLANGLKTLGHHVTVFAPTYETQTEEEDVVRFGTWRKSCLGGIVLPNPMDAKIEEEFRKGSFDIIHVHHPMLIGQTAAYLSGKYHVPLTFTYHTRYEQYLTYFKGIRFLERGAHRNTGRIAALERRMLHTVQERMVPACLNIFLRRCHYVFAPTEGMKQYLEKTCGFDGGRIGVLPTGIEEDRFQVTGEQKNTIREKYQAERIPLFLSVSRMAHEKNVTFLLKSIALLKEQYGRPFRVLMVGDGPNRGDYQSACRELGIEDIVIFTGKVPNEELAPYYAAADAFLFASKTETQGIVVLEAFAGGAPVLALEATGVSDLVTDSENGLLCREDLEIYTKNVLEFLTNNQLKERLSEGAKKTALEFRQEAVAQKAVRLYNRVIAEYLEAEKHNTGRRPVFPFPGLPASF